MRRLLVVTLLLILACGGSPSTPSTPTSPSPGAIADFSGLWTVTYRLDECGGDRHCVIIRGSTREFGLRLLQSGTHVRGVYTQQYLTVIDIEGDVKPDGSVVFSGFAAPISAKDGSTRLTNLTLRLSGGSLQGSVVYDTTPSPYEAAFQTNARYGGEIISAIRGNLPSLVASVEGTWNGRFTVRSCAAIGRFCDPHSNDDLVVFTLTLNRSGNVFVGSFREGGTEIQVTARMSGGSLELTGESLQPASGGPGLARLANWRATIDQYARMTGTFQFDYLFPAIAPYFGESASCELAQVVKTP